MPQPQRFDPLDQLLEVPLQVRCDPSAQLDLPLIEQAAQSLHRRLLRPGEAILLAQQPVDFSLGNHPRAQALKEQLASGHRPVTKSLHDGCWAGLPGVRGSEPPPGSPSMTGLGWMSAALHIA